MNIIDKRNAEFECQPLSNFKPGDVVESDNKVLVLVLDSGKVAVLGNQDLLPYLGETKYFNTLTRWRKVNVTLTIDS